MENTGTKDTSQSIIEKIKTWWETFNNNKLFIFSVSVLIVFIGFILATPTPKEPTSTPPASPAITSSFTNLVSSFTNLKNKISNKDDKFRNNIRLIK